MKPAATPLLATPTGILLAAGKGHRFDPSGVQNKLLATLREGPEIGLPVAFVAARRMRTALSRVIAVIDAQAPQRAALADWLRRAGCEVVEAPDAAEGMGASLAFAIRASLAEDAAGDIADRSGSPAAAGHTPGANGAATSSPTGWIVGLADMPMIAPATIQAVAGALTAGNDESIVAPVCDGRRGHPVGWGRAHGAALMALGGDTGARALIDAHAFIAVATGDEGVLRDIDRESDLG
ncbi:nucleotidyltransferase family protein [Robbsia sp. Bb-Pol-6]|uniref:Nucleotidyltransferase family protein n=1 Tax=Robbsia betulipollinis TaxID=2981849 RepID=A0ABT3ZLA0_9BURK|nr:nucleotidyltransferase family protein [Robbsia betulipollinis]MCY0387313.1 nucleotidyltransferase family protein [Robbsia betulipollinis]